MRIKILALLCLAFSFAWADDASMPASATQTPNVVPALAGGVNVDQVKACVANVNAVCKSLTMWEQKDLCTKQVFVNNVDQCAQAQAIYQAEGMLPYRIQSEVAPATAPQSTPAAVPVTVFTLYHLGDGQESFHMIDSQGALIDLVTDRDPSISASPAFQKIQSENPGAGLMGLVAGKVAESPQAVFPTALSNAKGASQIQQLVFPQMVKVPPCLACQNVATAKIAYEFSYPQGVFTGVKWLATEAASHAAPDVLDQN